jgi:hypothetical protein
VQAWAAGWLVTRYLLRVAPFYATSAVVPLLLLPLQFQVRMHAGEGLIPYTPKATVHKHTVACAGRCVRRLVQRSQ